MPAAKRSRSSRTKASNKRSKSLKADLDSAVTISKDLVSDDENVEQVAKCTKTKQTSANSKRWTPYFNSKKFHDGYEGPQLAAAGDGEAGDSKGLETAAMQECQSMRSALFEVLGPNGKPLNLGKFRAEFDTGADECMMTQSCYLQLKQLLKFQSGEAVIEGVTKGETRMTRYVELDLQIGSIRFPPGIKFWVNGVLPKDAGFDVLLSGPFLAHHNVICIDPELQREMERDGNNVELKIQRHLDFLGINRPLNKKEVKKMSHWD